MANPIPFRVATSGDDEDAPSGAVPVALYGAGGTGGGVASVNGQTGVVVLEGADIEVTGQTDAGIPDGTTVSAALGSAIGMAILGGSTADWNQIVGKPATVTQIPSSLGSAGQVLAVNAEGTGLEWVTPS